MSEDTSVVKGSDGLPLRTRVAHSIFWLTWSRGLIQLFSFATTVLVARILDPAAEDKVELAHVLAASRSGPIRQPLRTASAAASAEARAVSFSPSRKF